MKTYIYLILSLFLSNRSILKQPVSFDNLPSVAENFADHSIMSARGEPVESISSESKTEFRKMSNKIISNSNYSVDLIVFSYDRAEQLYAFFESLQEHASGLSSISLVYRVSNQEHKKSYEEVFANFSDLNINPLLQKSRSDFRELVLGAFNNSKSNYVAFAVDDIIITDKIDFGECACLMEQASSSGYNVLGFYLRLGQNIRCMLDKSSYHLPRFTKFNQNTLIWSFETSHPDWSYPNTVDLTVYKKPTISKQIHSLNFSSPNTLEGAWAGVFSKNKRMLGLCYEHSKIVNIPCNLVQEDCKNLTINSYSAQELLDTFNSGFKIDVSKFYKIDNTSCHFNKSYEFIKR